MGRISSSPHLAERGFDVILLNLKYSLNMFWQLLIAVNVVIITQGKVVIGTTAWLAEQVIYVAGLGWNRVSVSCPDSSHRMFTKLPGNDTNVKKNRLNLLGEGRRHFIC